MVQLCFALPDIESQFAGFGGICVESKSAGFGWVCVESWLAGFGGIGLFDLPHLFF